MKPSEPSFADTKIDPIYGPKCDFYGNNKKYFFAQKGHFSFAIEVARILAAIACGCCGCFAKICLFAFGGFLLDLNSNAEYTYQLHVVDFNTARWL